MKIPKRWTEETIKQFINDLFQNQDKLPYKLRITEVLKCRDKLDNFKEKNSDNQQIKDVINNAIDLLDGYWIWNNLRTAENDTELFYVSRNYQQMYEENKDWISFKNAYIKQIYLILNNNPCRVLTHDVK